MTAVALASRGYRWLFDHPRDDRFTAADFIAELERHGLWVGPRWRNYVRGHYVLGVADLRFEAPATT